MSDKGHKHLDLQRGRVKMLIVTVRDVAWYRSYDPMLISGKSSAFLAHKKHFFKGRGAMGEIQLHFLCSGCMKRVSFWWFGWLEQEGYSQVHVSWSAVFFLVFKYFFGCHDVVTSPLGGREKCVITCLIFLIPTHPLWGITLPGGYPCCMAPHLFSWCALLALLSLWPALPHAFMTR